ncbi:MAG: rubredoxin-like domain-containing protein [Candidatus Villigracilaceae bacterium]
MTLQKFYVCLVCGHPHHGSKSAPEKCPLCGAPGSKYEQVK